MSTGVERASWIRRPAAWAFAAAALFLPGAPCQAGPVKVAAMTSYSAGGTHQCKSEKGGNCIVSGTGFGNCTDASSSLQARDCCPTTRNGGTSSGFTMSYCIPEQRPGR